MVAVVRGRLLGMASPILLRQLDAERVRGIGGQPADGVLGRDHDAGALAVRDRLGGFLVQSLDSLGGVGVHDGAPIGRPVHQRDFARWCVAYLRAVKAAREAA